MSDATMHALYLALYLVLPISALVARRLPLGETVKMALAWVALFGALFLLVALWQGAMETGATVGEIFQ